MCDHFHGLPHTAEGMILEMDFSTSGRMPDLGVLPPVLPQAHVGFRAGPESLEGHRAPGVIANAVAEPAVGCMYEREEG
jgi:hypothetical protein